VKATERRYHSNPLNRIKSRKRCSRYRYETNYTLSDKQILQLVLKE
jgi:hypothetical protein